MQNISNLILILLCIPVLVFSQNREIKVYSNTLYGYSNQVPKRYDYEEKPFHFEGVSLAYRFGKKERTRNELEAFALFNNTDVRGYAEQMLIQLRYERGRYQNYKIFKIIDFYLSGSLRGYWLRERVDLASYAFHPTDIDIAGIEVAFIPHLEIPILKNLFLDINFNVVSLNLNVRRRYIHNPLLTENQRDYLIPSGTFASNRLLRIGLGYRFDGGK